MASAIFNAPYLSHPTSLSISPQVFVRKPSQISCSRTLIIPSLTRVPHLGFTPLSNWNGLRKHGFSISLQSLKLDKRKKCKKGVFASLFGVGAPEALVIGVVALLVFGPKGLAEVAKNLGKTLRAFQPTIRELQEVSREFKSTLEKEIGLDELQNPIQGNYTSNTLQNSQLTSTPPATTTEDSQETTTTPATTTEDSLATATSPVDTTEDSPATTTSPVDTTDDSAASTTSPIDATEDSQATTAVPAVTMEDSQPTADTTNGSPSVEAYSSEDLLKITEEELKAVASQQQKEQASSSTPSEEPKSEA